MIAIVAAYSKNRVIGCNGRIPWDIPGEQSRFRELTTGNVVVMGRRTYEEIGRPLPNRTTIVVSSTACFDQGDSCFTVKTLKEAIHLAGDRDIYISGGEMLYREALPLAEKLYITEIDAQISGDVFFPEFDIKEYKKITEKHFEGTIPYTYVTYIKGGQCMNYRMDRYGNDISILGYGCMRFTQKAGRIDLNKAEQEIMAAYNAGVNYYDTAYVYPGSEAVLGEILERNAIRDKVKIATKLPHYLIKNEQSFDKYFSEQLKRLRTDHVDYYLMHMLTDVRTWERLKELGIVEWIEEKKKSGSIRQIGFSYHGNSDMFCKLTDAYDWDFCQIQYNYLDENSQAGRIGLHYAAQKGLPVIIMEPLRGGRLAGFLPAKAEALFKEYRIKRTPAEWAFRWLWNQPEVTCVLSGMNSLLMVEENVKTASNAGVNEFSDEDNKLIEKVVAAINENMKVGCTGCRYCMPCPQGVDIPGTFASYNRKYSDGLFVALKEYFMCTALRKDSTAASNCIKCGKCEKHCPQNIEIRKELKNAKKVLENPLYKIGRFIVKLFKAY